MSYLVQILLALAALALAEEGLCVSVEAPIGVLLLACAPHLLAVLDRGLFLAGRFRTAAAVNSAILWSAPACYALAVLAFGWLESITRWTGAPLDLLGWPGPRTLLALAPFVLYTLLSIDARARFGDARPAEIARSRRFQARLFLSSLTPFALMVLCSWLLSSSPVARAHVEHVALWGGLFALLLIALTVVLLPWMLRRAWHTSPLPPGRTRTLLELFSQRIGFRCRELVQWHTGFQMSNAAVVGLGTGRIVLFSDLLLAQLGERELLAVFAHEIGHVVRHHVVVFVAWSLALLIGADIAITEGGVESEWLGVTLLLAVLGLWYLGFGWYSRRIELEADLYACEVTGDPEALVSALERVGSPHTRGLGSWRHFSTERRVAFLRQSAVDPRPARALVAGLRWLGHAGLVAGALVLAAQSWLLVASYPTDRVVAELALGRYERAGQLAEGIEDLDAELAALVVRALMLGEPQSAEHLAELGRAAHQSGDEAASIELLSLAQLRGAADVDAELAELAEKLAARTGSR